MGDRPLGWWGILRLGLVQTSLGAIVVLTTSTMNRVMVVELAMPAMLPGLLVGLHHAVQMLRPRMGFGSDVGGRHVPWLIGGIAVLGLGGIGAALSIALMASSPVAGVLAAALSFLLIGLGVGAAGTTLLVLMAKRVEARWRPAAATTTWLMMIAGFIVTTAVAGALLDPFSMSRLVAVTSGVAAIALLVTVIATWGIEGKAVVATAAAERDKPDFRAALREVWDEPVARRFTIFVFLSMLAFSMQDLILEPYAGLVFGFTPGESTQLSGLQHGGVLAGMIFVAVVGSLAAGRAIGAMRVWMVVGCIGAALALIALAAGASVGPTWPLRANVFALGFASGAFAVAAIATMMTLAHQGTAQREGLRMGLWGAAQAIAFAVGGFSGTVAVDLARWLLDATEMAYASVFVIEAGVFLLSAVMAARLLGARELHSTAHWPSAAAVFARLAQR